MSDPLSIVVAACKVAKEAAGVLDKVKSHRLSPAQQDILRAVAGTGQLNVIEPDQVNYPIVRAGQTAFGDERDPTSLALYWDAFQSLCKNGFIEHGGGVLFRLTSAGFERARALK